LEKSNIFISAVIIILHMKETVTIPKKEYARLKKCEETEKDLLVSLVKGLEDIQHGRIKPWKGATG